MCNRKTHWKSALLILAIVAVAGTTVLGDASLVGWWPLDDGAGAVVKDASGNGHDGAITGDPEWVAGWVGGALAFNGSNYVDTGYKDNLPNWTVSVWVKSPAAPANAAASGPIHREANF